MWKKILIGIVALVGTFSIAFAMNYEMSAAPVSSSNYYGIGENFERTNMDTFEMGGLNWRFIYIDTNTNEGYIMSENVASKLNCSNLQLGSYIYPNDVTQCMSNAQSYYNTSNDFDRYGSLFYQELINTNQLDILDLNIYNTITNNENDSDIINRLNTYVGGTTWLNDTLSNGKLLFWLSPKSNFVYQSYKHLAVSLDNQLTSNLNPILKVKLPKKGIIKNITSSETTITKKYTDSDNTKDAIISNIETVDGEGPYSFYVYDTDSAGTIVSYVKQSDYFILSSNSVSGTAKIKFNKKLPVGSYYLKVKVVDESTNNLLYFDSIDFTKDSFRSLETSVIHVKIEKGTQDPILAYSSNDDRTATSNSKTSFSVDKQENNITLYPDGGSSEIANDKFNYEIVNDTDNIIATAPPQGSTGTFSLTHNAGTATIKITKSGNDNLNEVSTIIQINTTTINDIPTITAIDDVGTYISASKTNKDIKVTFNKGPNGSTVNKDLKLKILAGNINPPADWYKTMGTESTITPGDSKTVNAASTQTYICYWLYYDGYLNEGVEFRVDSLKTTPKIKNPVNSTNWLSDSDVLNASEVTLDLSTANHTLDQTKVKLFAQGNTSTTYPLANINEGLYTLHLEDEYGNSDDIDFKVISPLYFVTPGTSTKISKDEVIYNKNAVYIVEAKGASSTSSIKYRVSTNNTIKEGTSNGEFLIIGTGTVDIEAYTEDGLGNTLSSAMLTVTVKPASQNFIFTGASGNELDKTGDKYNAYKETFAKDKKFQVYTNKTPDGITVTYELKDQTTAMSDVISVDSTTGEVTIINASKTNQMGKIVIIATAHDPSGTYSDQSIELPIIIEKGTRVVSFADDPIYVASGKGSITPVIHVDGIPETEGKANMSIEDNSADGIVWTDDTKTIEYEYSKEEAKEIQLKVTLPADRNYNIAEASGTLHIMGANDNALTISTPGKIVYGDSFPIKSTQDDSGSTNVQYTFEVNDTTYISSPTITGKEAVFDALKATGTNTVTVTVTRTADGELPSSKKVNIKVLPKPIEIIIDHKEKLKGEPNPTLTYQDFSKQLVSWNGTQDVIQANDIKLSTTAKETSEASDYPIKGDSSTLNKTYPNYTFTFKENTLTITEENIEDHWYHLELDDGKNTPYKGTWTNQDVNIISDHTDYKHISKDQSTWETPQVTVSTEGKTEQSFWLKKDSGAITSEKKETILIDKTAPTIKTITATDTNNKLQNIINQLTGGIFFKPGTQFEITTSDTKDELDVSGTNSIEYKIYKQNEDKSYGSPMKQDTLTVTNEKAKVTISDTTGTYKICVLPKDKAGNAAEEETCKEITLKKINVDIDGDGNDDFNDPDGDGCPDLNIVLGKNIDGEWIKLNIDTNNDNLPDLNIDTNGDGIADINVDQDGDGIPDLNIVKVTTWNPTVCVTGQAEEYCTDGTIIPNINVDLTGDGRPDINIDLNSDGIPDIDIDTDGDGKPDINIDTNKDGTADENLKKMSEWKIDAEVFEVKNVKFQTMKGLIRDTLDSLEDNGIVLEPGDGSIFLPNHAIKVTEISDEKIQESINQQTEYQEVKKIYDVKFLKDNIEAKPDGTMKVKIPLPDGIKNPQLMVQKSDGSYEKVNATLEDGYLVYETNEVGIVSIIGDKEENIDPVPDEPEDPEEPKGEEPEKPTTEEPEKPTEPKVDQPEPQPTVQGTYTTGLGNNMGGASTGDGTYHIVYFTVTINSLSILLFMFSKRSLRKKEN